MSTESSSITGVPVRTLDQFIGASSLAHGVHVGQLSPLTDLSVQTRNSLYRILVVDPLKSRVLVRGGQFFPLLTEATLSGSSLGGSCLKVRWIGEGFCMEIHAEDLTITTSPVRAIEFGQAAGPRPV